MDHTDEISKLIKELPKMPRPLLVAQWKLQFGAPPHPKLRIELMRPCLAYRIQEKAAGLSRQRVQGRMQELSSEAATSRFKAGTRIIREWNAKIHEVSVTDDGYTYLGERFKSLSPIASRITGTKWSGPAFFGTKPKERAK
jgi:hypothetical protein